MPDQDGRDLDARLAALGASTPTNLPGAEAARHRGQQRRRRTQLLTTGVGAVVAAGALVAGLALSGSGTDRVSIPDQANQPTLSPSPGASAPTGSSPSPGRPVEPERSAPASPAPPAFPGTGDSAGPRPTVVAVPAGPVRDRLLTTSDTRRAEAGSWERDSTPAQLPLLDPCQGGTAYPEDVNRTDTADTALIAREEGAGTSVQQSLARYRDAAAAGRAARGYERAVRGCPGGNDEQDMRTDSVVSSSTRDGVFTVIVRAAQEPFYAQYFAVQQRGDLVSVLSVASGSDGDPGVESIQPYLPVVLDRLGRG